MILLIDNYDSFVFNLERYFQRLGQQTEVVRNDRIDAKEVMRREPDAIVFSPGPCGPRQAGNSLPIARELISHVPMFGVCLGHQVLAEACGGRVIRAPQPMHGRTSWIRCRDHTLFDGLPSRLEVCRYHSLIVEAETLPDTLESIAETEDGLIMALSHRRLPVLGVQFHPEAILTRGGYLMLRNFLRSIGAETPTTVPDEWQRRPVQPLAVDPDQPLHF